VCAVLTQASGYVSNGIIVHIVHSEYRAPVYGVNIGHTKVIQAPVQKLWFQSSGASGPRRASRARTASQKLKQQLRTSHMLYSVVSSLQPLDESCIIVHPAISQHGDEAFTIMHDTLYQVQIDDIIRGDTCECDAEHAVIPLKFQWQTAMTSKGVAAIHVPGVHWRPGTRGATH
jgi:hypothetical protein